MEEEQLFERAGELWERPEEQTPEVSASPEARRISEGIAEALRDGSTIDDDTARLIALAITPGSGAIHELAMTGEITPDLGGDLEIAYQLLPEVADTWIAALDGYCWRRRDKGALPGRPRREVEP